MLYLFGEEVVGSCDTSMGKKLLAPLIPVGEEIVGSCEITLGQKELVTLLFAGL